MKVTGFSPDGHDFIKTFLKKCTERQYLCSQHTLYNLIFVHLESSSAMPLKRICYPVDHLLYLIRPLGWLPRDREELPCTCSTSFNPMGSKC